MAGRHASYPPRESHFAHKLVRLLFKSAAVGDIGLGGIALVTYVSHLEDASRYRGPIRCWNEQVANVLGVSDSQLRRTRDRCIEAGWLRYERSSKRSIGEYWTVIPSDLTGLNDDPIEPSDEVERLVEQQYPPQDSQVLSRMGDGLNGDEMTDKQVYRASVTDETTMNGRSNVALSNPSPNPKEEGAFSAEDSGKKRSKAKGKGNQSKDPPFDASAMDLPFASEEFKATWSEWVAERIERKNALNHRAAKIQLNRLAKVSEADAIHAIEEAISCGWKGIFPKPGQAKNEPPKVDTSTAGILGSLEKAGYRCVE